MLFWRLQGSRGPQPVLSPAAEVANSCYWHPTWGWRLLAGVFSSAGSNSPETAPGGDAFGLARSRGCQSCLTGEGTELHRRPRMQQCYPGFEPETVDPIFSHTNRLPSASLPPCLGSRLRVISGTMHVPMHLVQLFLSLHFSTVFGLLLWLFIYFSCI